MTDYEPLTGKAALSVELATAPVNVWEGSVRSGKTVATLINWLRYCRTGPPGYLLIAGKTERTVRRNLIGPLVEMVGSSRCRYVQGNGELTLLGRRCYVVGANDERAGEKIQGATLAGAYLDEMTTIPQSFWDMMNTRLSVKGAQLFATTNPAGPQHWAKLLIDRASLHVTGDGSMLTQEVDPEAEDDGTSPLNLHRFTFLLDRDNPVLLRDNPQYIDNMRRTYTGLFRKRYLDGQWVAADGAVFEMLTEGVHTAPAPTELGRCWLGIDFGMSNPTGAVLLAETWAEGVPRLHAVAEHRYSGKTQGTLTVAELSKQLTDWVQSLPFMHEGITVVVDPSALVLIKQLQVDGWRVTQANNSVLPGIEAMSNLFNLGRLVIDPQQCPWLWKELQGYVWDAKATKRGEDRPKKLDDHQIDSCRYACLSAYPVWRNWTGSPLSLAAAA